MSPAAGPAQSADPVVAERLEPAEIEACFDLSRHLRHVDTIFTRVFGNDVVAASERRAP